MLVFKNISYKNFMATGNKPISISLDDSKITLVTGNNGAGKSSLINAIFFVLYGKAFSNVNKNSLINSINQKNCLVELSLEYNNNKILVKRGIKPNIFEIYVNDKMIPQNSNVKAYQDWLQTNVLKMDEKTFRQIVVMGSTSFIPFMRLSASDRRTIIENLLCIEFFSDMNTIAKTRFSELKNTVNDLQSKNKEIEIKIEYYKKSSETIKQSIKDTIEDFKNQKTVITEKISSEIDRCSELLSMNSSKHIEEINQKTMHINNKLQNIETEIYNNLNNIEKNNKQMDFFVKNNSCPYCSQNISKELIEEKKEYYLSNNNETNKLIDELKKKYNEIKQESDELHKLFVEYQLINDEYKKSMNKLKEYKSSFMSVSEQIERYETKLTEHTNDKTELNELLSEQKGILNILNEQLEKIESYQHILSLLKDDGIKTIIVKNYLSTINLLLKKYIDAFDFNISFSFDEHFNETLKSRNRDIFEYGSFSEGEKLKIDLSLLFTFRELSKLRASVHTNLLIIDELDGKADSETQSSINMLLSNIGCNIVIITQYPTMYESIATRILSVTKENNFSKIITL